MTSIPVILCGKAAAVVLPAAQKYLPEVDVVHICYTVEAAISEIPRVLRGEAVVPASGAGSNTTVPADERRVPKAVIVGGAFTPEEFEVVRKADVKSVPWMKVELSKVPVDMRPPNPAYPAYAAASAKAVLKEHGVTDGPVNKEHVGALWDC